MKYAWLLLVTSSLVGCPGPSPTTVDSGARDASVGSGDTGTTADSGSTVDTGPAIDVGPRDAASSGTCAPAGTYDLVWTGAATNAAACPSPATLAEVGSDGFDIGFPACPTGCETTCMRTPLDVSTCAAAGRVEGPCLGLAAGRVIDATFAYSGDTATYAVRDSMTPAGACSYTGVGARR